MADDLVVRGFDAAMMVLKDTQAQLAASEAERDQLKAALLKIAMKADRRSAWCAEVAREALSLGMIAPIRLFSGDDIG